MKGLAASFVCLFLEEAWRALNLGTQSLRFHNSKCTISLTFYPERENIPGFSDYGRGIKGRKVLMR